MKGHLLGLFSILVFGVFLSISGELVSAQPSGQSGEPGYGRGGLDLGWGKPDDDEEDENKQKATPTPTPKLKEKDDTFFKRDVEDTGAGDKM